MLLAIDIGNTNIVIGCIQDDKILFEARIATDRTRTSDQYGVEIKNMLERIKCIHPTHVGMTQSNMKTSDMFIC